MRQALLAEICQNPDDDAPRLIYADWLEEHGGTADAARADFIRTQVASAYLSEAHPLFGDLQKRAAFLLGEHQSNWLVELPEFEDLEFEDFRRGFVNRVKVYSARRFDEYANELTAAAPLQAIHCPDLGHREIHTLLKVPILRQFREMDLSGHGLDPTSSALLGQCDYLCGLETLYLYSNRLGDRGALFLGLGGALQSLRELYLFGNRIANEGAASLAEHFPKLATLDLRDNHITDTGILALAHPSRQTNWETLYLVNNHIGDEGALALANTKKHPRLKRLYLNYNSFIGDEGAIALISSPLGLRLLELDLRNCRISDEGAREIAAMPYPGRMENLWLTGNQIGLRGAAALRGRFGNRVRL
jgi:uncharacterized protein (TIGR02996 family)